MIRCLQFGLVPRLKIALQFAGQRGPAEIIGKCRAGRPQCSELCAALCDQAIFIIRLLWVVHDYLPFVLP
jgi:hypothetical protein